MNKQMLKGILYVMIGASSCAVVGVIVKLAMSKGYNTPEIILSQTLLGTLAMIILYLGVKGKSLNKESYTISKSDCFKLLLGGIPLALTNTFYYLSIQRVPVAVATVMLMQSVWLGVVIDYFLHKVKPSKIKIIAILIIIIGTVFATNVLNTRLELNRLGLLFGFLAATAYSFTFFVTNNIGNQYHPIARSMYIVLGALILISIIWGKSVITGDFNIQILWTWGPMIAIFSMILPPLFLTRGMPLINIGLGSIIGSMELPVTAIVAYLLIDERTNIIQLIGMFMILFAVIGMNVFQVSKTNV